jgi:hypothetical protein
MDAGTLARTDIKALDPELYSSISNWLKHNRRKREPEGFKLLKTVEKNVSWANRVRKGEAQAPADSAEALRLAHALRRAESSRRK